MGSPAWKALESHYKKVRRLHRRKLFAGDPTRGERLTASAAGIELDYSKNRVTDETLALLFQLAKDAELRERIDGPSTAEIYGTYRYRHYTGAIAYEKFKKDGTSSLRIPMRSEQGCYKIDNEKVYFSPDGASKTSTELSVGPDEIVFKSGSGEFGYDAVVDGPWYKINEIDYVEPK